MECYSCKNLVKTANAVVEQFVLERKMRKWLKSFALIRIVSGHFVKLSP